MGISKIEVTFFDLALKMGVIPTGGHILELGESNLIPADATPDLLSIVAPRISAARIEEAARRAAAAAASKSQYQKAFGPARALYYAIFDPASYTALDLDQGPRRFCFDLNCPINLQQQFDCVINNGTSEHIFDQANVFRVMHDHTRPGGAIIHWTPSLGWPDHGLYNVQPDFFDLAAANGYEISLIALTDANTCFPLQRGHDLWRAIAEHPALSESAVCAVLTKRTDASFKSPIQGMWNYQSPLLNLALMQRRRTLQKRPNLALNRPALQSSTSIWSWHEDAALDAAGGNNGQVTGFYSFHTDFEHQPWWMVDLRSNTRHRSCCS